MKSKRKALYLGFVGLTAGVVLSAYPLKLLAANFSDLQGYWGEPYVSTLADRTIIGGFPDGSFRPNNNITRAQFAAIAAKALNLPTSSSRNFVDVPAKYWASGAIGAVSSSGLVTGYPDGTFRPEQEITRAQALVILAKAMKNAESNPTALSRYSDADAVPDWAKESVTKAATANIIVNFPESTKIEPNRLATRGEVAALVYQALSKLGSSNLPPVSIGLIGGGSSGSTPTPQPTSQPSATKLALNQVTLNVPKTVLSGGDEVEVEATGTAKANATLTIEGVVKDSPMKEIKEGVYRGNYTVRKNDNQARARVSVTLSYSGAEAVTKEAEKTITLDALGPVIKDPQPAKLEKIPNRQPDISVVLSDGPGSGVDTQNFIAYRPAQPFTGDRVTVEVKAADQVGNTSSDSWVFGFGTGSTSGNNSGGQQQSLLFPQVTNYKNNDSITLPDVIQGTTAPNAAIQVKAEAYTTLAGILGVSSTIYQDEIKADRNGKFSFTLQSNLPLRAKTRYRLQLTATDPDDKKTQQNELFLIQK
jgi:hypothetical protein